MLAATGRKPADDDAGIPRGSEMECLYQQKPIPLVYILLIDSFEFHYRFADCRSDGNFVVSIPILLLLCQARTLEINSAGSICGN